MTDDEFTKFIKIRNHIQENKFCKEMKGLLSKRIYFSLYPEERETMKTIIDSQHKKQMRMCTYKQFLYYKCYKYEPRIDTNHICHWLVLSRNKDFTIHCSEEQYNEYLLQSIKDYKKYKIEHICKEEL